MVVTRVQSKLTLQGGVALQRQKVTVHTEREAVDPLRKNGNGGGVKQENGCHLRTHFTPSRVGDGQSVLKQNSTPR